MTEQRLAEIEAREKAATEGPWVLVEHHRGTVKTICKGFPERWVLDALPIDQSLEQRMRNAEFAANARTDIPYLLTALRAAEAREARLREALEAIKQATLDGRVCDDVAWFDTITTLHDYCELVLLGPDTRQSELPLQALEQKP